MEWRKEEDDEVMRSDERTSEPSLGVLPLKGKGRQALFLLAGLQVVGRKPLAAVHAGLGRGRARRAGGQAGSELRLSRKRLARVQWGVAWFLLAVSPAAEKVEGDEEGTNDCGRDDPGLGWGQFRCCWYCNTLYAVRCCQTL